MTLKFKTFLHTDEMQVWAQHQEFIISISWKQDELRWYVFYE